MENQNRITQGVLWKQILRFFGPLLLGTFFQQLYNTTDAVIVGRFVGKQALSAVGGTSSVLINLFLGFFIGLSSGATVTISQFYGAKNEKNVGDAVHTAIALSIAGGLFFTVLGVLIAPGAIALLRTPSDVAADSVLYFRIYFLGMVANLIYNVGAGILRAVGDSRRPLYFLIISTVANIGLDILFVVVFRMAVFGVALATVLCQILSALLVLRCLSASKTSYRLEFRKIRFHLPMLRRILQIGLPAALQSVMYAFSNVLIQSAINSFGTDTMAAWTAYGKIDAFFWMTINSFGIAATTFVGQNYGAGLYPRVRKTVRTSLALSLGTTVFVSVLFLVFRYPLLSIFTTDADVTGIGVRMMEFLVPTYVTYISIEILSGTLRGMGDALLPMIITCLGVCVLRVGWILIAVPISRSVTAIMVSYPLTWTVTSVLFWIYYEYYVRKHHIVSNGA